MQPFLRKMIWLVYWVLLATSTHLPPSKTIQLPGTWLDKLAHFLVFVLLSLLAGWALQIKRRTTVITWGAALCAYAALDEWTQAWVNRSPEWGDWAANCGGIVAGMTLYWVCLRTGLGPRASSLASNQEA